MLLPDNCHLPGFEARIRRYSFPSGSNIFGATGRNSYSEYRCTDCNVDTDPVVSSPLNELLASVSSSASLQIDIRRWVTQPGRFYCRGAFKWNSNRDPLAGVFPNGISIRASRKYPKLLTQLLVSLHSPPGQRSSAALWRFTSPDHESCGVWRWIRTVQEKHAVLGGLAPIFVIFVVMALLNHINHARILCFDLHSPHSPSEYHLLCFNPPFQSRLSRDSIILVYLSALLSTTRPSQHDRLHRREDPREHFDGDDRR